MAQNFRSEVCRLISGTRKPSVFCRGIYLSRAETTLFSLGRSSPRVDDRDASSLERLFVARSYAESPGSGNRRDLGVRNGDRMTMPASSRDNFRVGFSPSDIEGHYPLGEQGDDLFIEGSGEGLATFADREACDTEQ